MAPASEPDGRARGARYSRGAILLHWSTAVLILITVPLGLTHDWLENRFGLVAMPLHKSIGMTILVLTVIRILWRLNHRPPPQVEGISPGAARIARAVHIAFYTLLVSLPITGWLVSSASPYPLVVWGLLDVPKAVISRTYADIAALFHEWGSWAFLLLLGLHVAGALKHHFELDRQYLRRIW